MRNKRRLFIIGNGFDLAHGLETRYDQFLLWYLKEVAFKVFQSQNDRFFLNDNLIDIRKSAGGIFNQVPIKIESIDDFKQYMKDCHPYPNFDVNYSFFFQKILEDFGWADIEKVYYQMLVDCTKPSHSSIEVLNNSFETIKKELENYLIKNVLPDIKNKQALPKLQKILGEGKVISKRNQDIFINFNYTNALCDLYNVHLFENAQVINIHGLLNDKNNPIIFGYGDEMDRHFEVIENMDDNKFLLNMKSFGYFRTDEYMKILNFMNSDDILNKKFDVHIIGHSMGLSDRLLLNTVFEHPNCQSIEIHYSSELDNFDQLARNMSRHFNLKLKGSMREKIVPYLDTRPMD